MAGEDVIRRDLIGPLQETRETVTITAPHRDMNALLKVNQLLAWPSHTASLLMEALRALGMTVNAENAMGQSRITLPRSRTGCRCSYHRENVKED